MSKRWLPTWRGEITMSPHPELKGSGSDCDLIIMVNTMITELARRKIKDKTLTAASDYLNELLTEKQTGNGGKQVRLKKTEYKRNGHTKIVIECEHCGYTETIWAYDDRTFWEEELPSMKCKKCKKDGGFKEWSGIAK